MTNRIQNTNDFSVPVRDRYIRIYICRVGICIETEIKIDCKQSIISKLSIWSNENERIKLIVIFWNIFISVPIFRIFVWISLWKPNWYFFKLIFRLFYTTCLRFNTITKTKSHRFQICYHIYICHSINSNFLIRYFQFCFYSNTNFHQEIFISK